jgi:hypothetical protein
VLLHFEGGPFIQQFFLNSYSTQDQLGQEQEFIVQQLPNGRTSIDGFCVVFDVSRIPGRSFGRQATVAIDLLLGALKTEKPILFVATKFDKADMEGIQEFQRLFQRKELKSGLLNHQMFTVL